MLNEMKIIYVAVHISEYELFPWPIRGLLLKQTEMLM